MQLIGRYLSPYVRRVAIWCALQGREVENLPLPVMGAGDTEAIRDFHPGRRVPVLVLDDGTKLVDSWAICDWLDDTAPEGRRFIPATGVARRDGLQRMALAQAASEKAVALVYDNNRRPEEYHWPEWQERLRDQIRGSFSALEALVPDAGFFGGDAPDGADIAAVCAYHFAFVTNPDVVDGRFPKLAALAERAMDVPAFRETYPG